MDLPEGVIPWRNFACKVELSESGGYCVNIYQRELDVRWTHSQLGCATLPELNQQLAITMDQIFRRGFEAGRKHVRDALGFQK